MSTDLVADLLAALKVARWFIVTAHDADAPYVGKVLDKVDAAIAKGELAAGNTDMQHSGP